MVLDFWRLRALSGSMRRPFEIQLSHKSLTNQSLRTKIEELEQFLRAEGPKSARFLSILRIILKWRTWTQILEKGWLYSFGALQVLRPAFAAFLTLSSWALQRSSASSLCPELLSLRWLWSVQSRSATGIQSPSCCGCWGPLAKAFNDVECYEVLTETTELWAAHAAQGRIKWRWSRHRCHGPVAILLPALRRLRSKRTVSGRQLRICGMCTCSSCSKKCKA